MNPAPGAEAARWAEEVFGPGGSVASAMPGFEHRPQQVEMAARVRQTLAAGRMALIEAGTGTGKSLAYLYPGLLHARLAGGPLIVSTNTINLQEQLLTKDLPLLASLCPEPPKVALLLGRGNYICRRRLEYALRQGTLDLSEKALRGLSRAVREGRGERNKLGLVVSEEIWRHLASDVEFCLRPHCPWSEDCFWLAARRAAAEAEIVLVNHHLLLADVAVRAHLGWEAEQAVLPAYSRVVFDEAHHLEDIATEHLSLRLGSAWLARLLDRLHLREGPGSQGVLTVFQFGLRTSGGALPPERAAEASDLSTTAMAAVEQAKARADLVFGSLLALAREGRQEGATWQRRYTQDLREFDPALGPAAEDLLLTLQGLDNLLQKLLDAWEGENAETPETEEGLAIRYLHAELAGFCGNLPTVLAGESREHVYWLEASRRRGGEEVEAIMAPLRVGPLFHSMLLANLESAVFTSATLTAGGDFGYLRERLGLDLVAPAERMELCLPSPFDYRRRVLLAAAGDLPEPDDARFPEAAAVFLAALLRVTRGRTLVLFTSFNALDRICDLLQPALPEGLKLLRQGEGPRSALIAAFQDEDGAVLCGTDSFWEGVDVPGLALSCVVLARLPFRVPTEPVAAARMELVEQEGGSSFQRYSLPQAVIKFKQGFGRLVRRGDDGGAVVVLDRRFLSKNYGRIFREADRKSVV